MAQLLRHLAIRHIDARKVEYLSNGLGAKIVAEFAHQVDDDGAASREMA